MTVDIVSARNHIDEIVPVNERSRVVVLAVYTMDFGRGAATVWQLANRDQMMPRKPVL